MGRCLLYESPFARRYVTSRSSRPVAKPDTVFWNIAKTGDAHAEISIYDEIGFFGTTAGEFRNQLKALDVDHITLRLNSPGGDVFDALAIYNQLREHRASIDVIVDGLAASAASFIAMAGDTIKMSRHSRLMIHEAWGVAIGPAADMRKSADMLESLTRDIADIYSERSGRPVDVWLAYMQAETWFEAQEAVDAGLADEVLSSFAPKNAFDLSMFLRPPVDLVFPAATAASAARTNNEPTASDDALRHEQLLALAEADAHLEAARGN